MNHLNFMLCSLSKSILIIFILFVLSTRSTIEGKEQEKTQLSKIVILDFKDETGDNYHGYLSASIADAIDSALLKKFEYKQQPDRKVIIALQKLAKKIIANSQKTNKRKKVKRLKFKKDFYITKKNATEIANKTKTDIIISGSYKYNKNYDRLIIETNLYFHFTKEWFPLEKVETKIDHTIFDTTEKISTLTIKAIDGLVLRDLKRQAALKEEEEKKTKQPEKKNGKTVLSFQEEKKETSKWQINLGGGLSQGITSISTLETTLASSTHLGFNYQFFKGLYVGGLGILPRINYIDKQNNLKIGMMTYLGALTFGYYLKLNDFKLLEIPLEFGAGYYLGSFFEKEHKKREILIYNPAILFSSGVEFNLIKYLKIGTQVRYALMLDKPKNIQTIIWDIYVSTFF